MYLTSQSFSTQKKPQLLQKSKVGVLELLVL